jgi:hypothetical protein
MPRNVTCGIIKNPPVATALPELTRIKVGKASYAGIAAE